MTKEQVEEIKKLCWIRPEVWIIATNTEGDGDITVSIHTTNHDNFNSLHEFQSLANFIKRNYVARPNQKPKGNHLP